MANKIHNIFESAFDSFELEDEFLLKVDADLKKHSVNNKKNCDVENKLNCRAANTCKTIQKENKISDKKPQFDNISLFLDELNEADFFDSNWTNKKKSKVTDDVPNSEVKVGSSSCLSPILGPKLKNKFNRSFSSTPLKPINDVFSKKEKKEPEENLQKASDYAYVEADLFDDWGSEINSLKDSVTLSQAFKLIEEAESAKETNKKDLNTSIDLLTGEPVDLLTGEPVGAEVGDLFAESFTLPNSPKNNSKKENSNDSVVILGETNTGSKPPAAQRLNFGSETEERKSFGACFNSDDDFDFLTQDLLNKQKDVTKLKDFSLDESSENIKKRGKCCRIIESDSADDSLDSESKIWNKKKITRQKSYKKGAGREFIESEADVSDKVEVSSDESEQEGEYDASFVDEELYLTQNCSADMTAKYLESVKNSNRIGRFKIPAPKPYNPANVFSQVVEDNTTDYELDSFCVNDVEEETKAELSDLEIAEHILEMDRKKRKRKRIFQGWMKIK